MISTLDLLGRFGSRLSLGARRTIENRSPVPLAARQRSWSMPSLMRQDYRAQMEVYSTDAVVYPIVERLMSATADAEWELWAKAASGLEEDRTKVTSHAVIDLIERPNRFMTGTHLIEAGQQHEDLTGETNIIVGRAPGVKYPIDLYPIRPDRLEPVTDPYDYLKGWIYTGPDGDRVPLETDELLRKFRPSPLDLYRGMGPIQALMLDLDSQRYGKEWQASFFQNSARPGGVIEVDRRLGDDEFDEMRDRWAEQHQGLSKAHRVAIIENGAKWIETSYSMRDLQFAEMDSVGRDKALVAYGFPKSMLGIVEDVNRANAEAGEYMFARWLTKPRLKRWRSMFNTQLLPLYGEQTPKRYELDFKDPVPENGEQALQELDIKSKALVLLVSKGYDSAEVLDMLDWPALSYTAPPPPTMIAPPGEEGAPQPRKGQEKTPPPSPATPDAAMRWVVKGEEDDNACDPCKENHGKTYRNRQSAYADYPGGAGYIKCVGAQYGNKCRCTVTKRRGREQAEA